MVGIKGLGVKFLNLGFLGGICMGGRVMIKIFMVIDSEFFLNGDCYYYCGSKMGRGCFYILEGG